MSTYINLPKYIQNKKAVTNIVYNDPYCFLQAVTSALYPVGKNPDRKSSYPHFSEILKYDIKFPISLTDVPKFEKMHNLRIDIHGQNREENDKKGAIVSFYISKETSNSRTIHLLMIENSEIDMYDKITLIIM